LADAWGGSWGQSWGVSWGAGEAAQPTLGAGGGRYRYWSPVKEPKKRKKREEKIAVIEAVVSQPIADIDLSDISELLKAALAAAVPDYRAIVKQEQKKQKPDPEAIARQEQAAEEARVYDSEYERYVLEQERVYAEELKEFERQRRKKELLAKKRDRNRRIINMLLH
jgi:hypothetical protein